MVRPLLEELQTEWEAVFRERKVREDFLEEAEFKDGHDLKIEKLGWAWHP